MKCTSRCCLTQSSSPITLCLNQITMKQLTNSKHGARLTSSTLTLVAFQSLSQNKRKLPCVVCCEVTEYIIYRQLEKLRGQRSPPLSFSPSVHAVRAVESGLWSLSSNLTFWTCLSLMPISTQTCLVLGQFAFLLSSTETF